MSPERLRVLVLFGGRSAEHGISCLSARNVLSSLDRARYDVTAVGITREGRWTLAEQIPEGDGHNLPEVAADGPTVALVRTGKGPRLLRCEPEAGDIGGVDVVFPVLHGPYGEDGAVQGLLDSVGVAYVGAGVTASALGMDKSVAKELFALHGLPQVPFVSVREGRWKDAAEAVLDELTATLAPPWFTKPARQGSSIGISRCRDRDELAAGIVGALVYDEVVVVEQGVCDAREIECGVLGNATIEVSAPGEIVTGHDFYDFDGKYRDEGLRLDSPAEVPDAVVARCRELAVGAFRAIGARGMARVDFFYLPEQDTVLVNEINTIPGFTAVSMFPLVWASAGYDGPALVDRLIDLAGDAARSVAARAS